VRAKVVEADIAEQQGNHVCAGGWVIGGDGLEPCVKVVAAGDIRVDEGEGTLARWGRQNGDGGCGRGRDRGHGKGLVSNHSISGGRNRRGRRGSRRSRRGSGGGRGDRGSGGGMRGRAEILPEGAHEVGGNVALGILMAEMTEEA